MRDQYVFRVKSPSESKGEWDLYSEVARIPANEAYGQPDAKICPLIKS